MQSLSHFFKISTLSLLFASSVKADGPGAGGGGDFIRSNVLSMGQAVVSYLSSTATGQEITKKFDLDLRLLNSTLMAKNFRVVQERVKDRDGSLVDAALMSDDVVDLYEAAWKEHIDKRHDVYHLVFHEMLRKSHKYNDENFAISGSLRNFNGRPSEVYQEARNQEVPDKIYFLRNKFRMADYPTAKDLKLGQNWSCFRYETYKFGGASERKTNEYKFSVVDDSLYTYKNDGHSYEVSFEYFLSAFDPITDQVGELTSHGVSLEKIPIPGVKRGYRQDAVENYVRVSSDGSLIIEESLFHTPKYHTPLQSLVRPQCKVFAYKICKTDWN